MRRVALLASLPVVLLSCSSSRNDASPEVVGARADAYTQQCAKTTVEGVDVSDGQGSIDWSAVKAAGRDFAFMKATQGTYFTAKTFAANWSGAKKAGVLRSAYHFFDPTEDGVAQANHFLNVVGTIGPDDLPAMLDVECPDGDSACLGWSGGTGDAPASDIVKRATDWLVTVTDATGKKPIVYTFPAYFPDLSVDTSALGKYPLYIATIASCASVPAPWKSAVFWQYSWTGTVSGISGQVDMDRFFGSMTDLQAFASTTGGGGAGGSSGAGGAAGKGGGAGGGTGGATGESGHSGFSGSGGTSTGGAAGASSSSGGKAGHAGMAAAGGTSSSSSGAGGAASLAGGAGGATSTPAQVVSLGDSSESGGCALGRRSPGKFGLAVFALALASAARRRPSRRAACRRRSPSPARSRSR